MEDGIRNIAEGFWNIRGSFKVGGLIDVGTHVSLVRLSSGRFVFLDSYSLDEATERAVLALTDEGRAIEAILNVHPFHTVHVRKMHAHFPNAKLYGTARHVSKLPELPWERLRTEDAALHAIFEEDLDFSVPRGVDFISDNENVHFSSVLVLHRASNTIHVDDTLMYVRLPKPAQLLGFDDLFRFHPTLRLALQRRPGAAQEFRDWANDLAERWRDADNLCAAHTAVLTAADHGGPPIHRRVLRALEKAERTLKSHERKYR
jgi:hypothetical protein